MSNLKTPRPGPVKQTKFSPPDLLKINQRDPNFTYRWIRPGDKMTFFSGQDVREWEIVRFGAKGQENNSDLNGLLTQFSVTALGSVIRVGDLILARMPKARAEERNEYYLEKHRERERLISDPKRNIGEDKSDLFEGSAENWKEQRL